MNEQSDSLPLAPDAVECKECTKGPTTRRRWLRFRLSSLLVLITGVCIVLAIRYQREPLAPHNLSGLGVVVERIESDAWKVAWNGDGSRFAVVRWDKPVQIHEGRTLFRLSTIGEGKKIVDFAFGPRHGIFAFGEHGPKAVILDESKGKTIDLETVNEQPSVLFSRDGRYLVTGGYGQSAYMWDSDDGQLLREFDTGVVGGLHATFDKNGSTLAVGSRNGVTTVFDVATGRRLYALPKQCSHAVLVNPVTGHLAVAYVDGSVGIWNCETGELLHMVETDAEEVFVLDWSSDGKLLITAGLKGSISIWNAKSMKIIRTVPAMETVFGVKFRPDQASFVTAEASSSTGTVRCVREWEISLLARTTE
jgi:WD40 repeat protein